MIWVYLAYCWELSECTLFGMSQPCHEPMKASCPWETGKAFLLGQVPRGKAFVWSKYEFMSNWPVCTTSNLSYPFWITVWDFLNTDTFYQKPANVSLCAVPNKCIGLLGSWGCFRYYIRMSTTQLPSAFLWSCVCCLPPFLLKAIF